MPWGDTRARSIGWSDCGVLKQASIKQIPRLLAAVIVNVLFLRNHWNLGQCHQGWFYERHLGIGRPWMVRVAVLGKPSQPLDHLGVGWPLVNCTPPAWHGWSPLSTQQLAIKHDVAISLLVQYIRHQNH
ncbi:uncharacterized protein N7473_001887 [Penicillium subrubescens]|uniref:uncharacterized protein n=1 Tax=Penicillium subrubescens TaxID=1316194 RepID=UPI002544F851|nr:uncharacterized protein N7473_001887 [Penicillium subrubescens]KAJ5904971.1 hypothetical protein N7473_001887 [Penicillium subrubescens]